MVTNSPIVAVDVSGSATQNVVLAFKAAYDTFGNVVAKTRPDPGLAPTTFQYDALDRLSLQTTPVTPGNCCGGSAIAEAYTYDGDGNVLTHVDPRGKTTSFSYDRLNRLIRKTDPQLTGQSAAGFTKYGYDDVGNLVSTTDQRGAVVNAGYDELNRKVSETVVERIPTTQNFTTTFAYDDLGNLTSVKDPLNNTNSALYNDLGEQTSTTDEAGKITSYLHDVAGRQTQLSDPLNRKVVSAYDQAGRLTTLTNKNAANVTVRTESFGYDGASNQTSVTSPNGWTTTRTFDKLNQLRTVVQPTTASVSITTTFGYDYNGNRTFVTDGRGNTTWTTYNALDLKASVIEPSTTQYPALADRTWNYSYDATGNNIQIQEPGNVTQTQTFDELGRMTSAAGTGGSGATTSRSIGYDLADNVVSVGTPGGDQTFTRNDRGTITSQSGPEGNASFVYDANGRLTSRVDAAGTTGYTYTARSQVATVADPLTAQTFTYTYDDAMQLSTAVANGKTRTYGYDALGRVTSDALTTGTTANNRSVTYGYDSNSNVTSQSIVFGGSITQNNTYTYDRADRMTNWTQGAASTAYAWDGAGNRTTNGGVTSTYNQRNHLVSDSAGVTYTYTKRGTMATRTASGNTVTLNFDSFNRLIYDSTDSGMSNPGLTYDSLDRLYARNGSPVMQYDGADNANVVNDGAFTYSYTPDGTPLAASDGTTKRALLSNQHGDITGSYDVNGTNSTSRVDYDPFGRKSNASGFQSNLGYQGSWNNSSSSAQRTNMWQRWYAPNQGVFLSRDDFDGPINGLVDVNRQTYGADNPMRYVDPFGMWGMAPNPVPASTGPPISVQPTLRYNPNPSSINWGALGRTSARLGRAVARVSWPLAIGLEIALAPPVSGGTVIPWTPSGLSVPTPRPGPRIEGTSGGPPPPPPPPNWPRRDGSGPSKFPTPERPPGPFENQNPKMPLPTLPDLTTPTLGNPGSGNQPDPYSAPNAPACGSTDDCESDDSVLKRLLDVSGLLNLYPEEPGEECVSTGKRFGSFIGRTGNDSISCGTAQNSADASKGSPPRFITTEAGITIDRMAINTSISTQKQGRHVLGARQYGGGSYFNSAGDAQRVLDDFHSGEAHVLGVKGNDIVVRSPNVTGINVNPGAGYPSQVTDVFFIKGSSSPSVVPYNPEWMP